MQGWACEQHALVPAESLIDLNITSHPKKYHVVGIGKAALHVVFRACEWVSHHAHLLQE